MSTERMRGVSFEVDIVAAIGISTEIITTRAMEMNMLLFLFLLYGQLYVFFVPFFLL